MAYVPVIASPLKKVPHVVAFDELCYERFTAIQLEKLLVTMFDTVDASLLDILAAQYDMLGYNGWVLAENDQEKRELLKGAVGLHKMMGTAGGIREVVQRLGFQDIIIEEGWENFTDGSDEPEVNPWAYFRVVYVLPNNKSINAELAQNLIGLVNNYKNARSVLANFGFAIPQRENLALRGVVTLRIINDSTNAVISETIQNNMIVADGVYWLAKTIGASNSEPLAFPDNVMRIERVRFSSHSGVPAFTDDLSMFATVVEKALDINPDPEGGGAERHTVITDGDGSNARLRHWFSLGASEGNGQTIRTLCLIMRDATTEDPAPDSLFARILREPIAKTSAIRLEGTWDVYFGPNVSF